MSALGELVRLTFDTYSDSANTVPADPTALTLDVLAPDGTTVSHAWPGDITKDTVGQFHYDVDPTLAGRYTYHWGATGTVVTAADGAFLVEPKLGAALATVSDVTARLGRSLSTEEAARAVALLSDASSLVRRYCRQDFNTRTTTDLLRITAGRVRLPQRPVTAVTSVKLVGSDGVQRFTVPFVWDGLDEVLMMGDLLVINLPEILHDVYATTAEVSYTHGYATIPDDVVAVTARIVARVFMSPPTPGVKYQTAGPFSYNLADGYGAGEVTLSAADRELLDGGGYRRSTYAVGLL